MKNQSLYFLGFLLGFCGWNLGQAGHGLLIFLPVLWVLSKNRLTTFLIFFCYYVGSTFQLLLGAYEFLDHDVTRSLIYWAILQLILPTSWIILWKKDLFRFTEIFLRLLGTFFVITLIPPYSFIGLASPLMMAGYFFPGMGYGGLLMYLVSSTLLVKVVLTFTKRKRVCPIFITCISLFFGLSIILNLTYQTPHVPKGWVGMNTNIGQYIPNDLKNYLRHFKLKQVAQEHVDSGHKVNIFPEMIAGKWTDIESQLWKDIDQYANKNNAIILLGVQEVILNEKYENALVILGDQSLALQKFIRARLPMPISNWNPFSKQGAELNISPNNKGTVFIAGKKTAVLFCYETMLFWPILQSMLDQPEVILFVSNLWWAKETKVSEIVIGTIRLLSRLFDVPVVLAVNYG